MKQTSVIHFVINERSPVIGVGWLMTLKRHANTSASQSSTEV